MKPRTLVLWLALMLSQLFCAIFSAAGENERSFASPFPWLVEVSSVLTEEASGVKRPTQGVGFLARSGNRYFVVSDSHLSQGENTQVRISGQTGAIAIIGEKRLANNDADLEVMEIAAPSPEIHPVFVWNEFRASFELEDGYDLDPAKRKDLVLVGGEAWAPIPPRLKSAPLPYRESEHGKTPVPGGPILDIAREARGITFNSLLHDQVVDSQVVRGMSGAPLLFRNGTTGKITVGGLAKSYHRFFERSYFSHGSQISEVFRSYFYEGKRGYLTPSRWHFRKGVGTYLDYGDGSVEINPWVVFSGGGEGGDVGGGEGGDVGGGEGGDVGNVRSTHAESSYSSLGLRSGMLYQGKPALAFRFGGFKAEGIYGYPSVTVPPKVVYANRVGEEYIKRIASGRPIEVIQDESALMDLARERMRNAELATSGPMQSSSTGVEECLMDESALAAGSIRLKLSRAGQSVVLELDSRGVLKSSSYRQFEPVVKLPLSQKWDQSPRELIVDLKGLFFADMMYSEQPTLGLISDPLSPELDPRRRSSYLSSCEKAPCVIIRWPEDGRDYSVTCKRSKSLVQASILKAGDAESGCSSRRSSSSEEKTGKELKAFLDRL